MSLADAVQEKIDDMREGFRLWLTALVRPGVAVVDGNQYRPQPVYPFVSYGFLGGFRKLGRSDAIIAEADGKFYMIAHRQATFSVFAHGKPIVDSQYSKLMRATDILTAIQMGIDEPVAYGNLSSRGIAILGDNGVLNTTIIEENTYMPRATLDLIVGLSIKAEVLPGWIESVEVTGRVDMNFDGIFEKVVGPYTYEEE